MMLKVASTSPEFGLSETINTMTRRYDKRVVVKNNLSSYGEQLSNRRKSFIDQFSTPVMTEPSMRQLQSLQTIKHVWSMGDRYYKLAHRYYGRSDAWWVIAQYNKRPTESHMNYGDIVFIPMPLDMVVS